MSRLYLRTGIKSLSRRCSVIETSAVCQSIARTAWVVAIPGAVDDIGKYGARAFTDASALNGRELDLAGDALTMPQAARIPSGGLGRTIEFMHVPIEEVRKNSEDMALMLQWFDRVGYDADIEGLEREFGIKPAKLKEWAGGQRG